MKNFTLTLIFVFALIFSASAQNNNPALEKTSTRLTRSMVESMGLNESEYIKLKKLNQQRIALATEAEKMYADDVEMRDVRLREIDDEFEQKLFNMLNSRQVEAYAEFKQKPEGNFLAVLQEMNTASTSSNTNSKKK